jgi:hypothetical protein
MSRPAGGQSAQVAKTGGAFGTGPLTSSPVLPLIDGSSRDHTQDSHERGQAVMALLPLFPKRLELKGPWMQRISLRDSLASGFLVALIFLSGRLPRSQHQLLILYYQPVVPPLALLWLWSVAVSTFQGLRISYEDCFPVSQRDLLLSAPQLRDLASCLTCLAAVSACAFSTGALAGWTRLASSAPPALYIVLLALLTLPLNGALHAPSRLFFARTLAKAVLLPAFLPVGWADFLLADMLTSLSKPLSDAERALCHMVTAPVLEPLTSASGGRASGACSDASPAIPLLLALPYLWRLAQCVRCYADTRQALHLGNAAKYATAIPVILLSHFSYRVSPRDWISTWQPAWMAASLLNTCFNVYWDTERDWAVPWLAAGRWLPSPSAKTPRLYGRPRTYYVAMALNAALRISWTHKLSSHLRHYRLVGLLVCLGEILRRFLWCFFRIESELFRIQAMDERGDEAQQSSTPVFASGNNQLHHRANADIFHS